ncbi:site-specific integrase [Pseudoduganella sp. R-32]|uniref:site-specific integrase n=1 Tax=unclassified Pseudoduganella TaxID=2637179 RepID=UPI003CF041A1
MDARNYGEQVEALLAQGHLPHDLVTQRVRVSSKTLAKLMRDYQAAVPVSALDSAILHLLRLQIGAERADRVLKYQWAEDWVRSLKLEHHLAPGTIRKRVGAVARLLDWFLKREAKAGEQPIANPLRLLPKNYSTYNAHEGLLLEARDNIASKKDVSRDRRLEADEEARIVAALRGDKREGRERALELPDGAALMDLFLLLVNTGLRLREAYTLRVQDVRLDMRTVHIRRSKTGAARDVPLLPDVYALLKRRVEEVKGAGAKAAIFPWWIDGADSKELARVTSLLSRALGRAFAFAECNDLTAHDLRHEATCRWVLMKDGGGVGYFVRRKSCVLRGTKIHACSCATFPCVDPTLQSASGLRHLNRTSQVREAPPQSWARQF